MYGARQKKKVMGHKKSSTRHGVATYVLLIREIPEVCQTPQGFAIVFAIVNHHNYMVRPHI